MTQADEAALREMAAMCQEIVAWHQTGLLKGEALRQFAKNDPVVVRAASSRVDDGLQLAEDRVLNEVAKAFPVLLDALAAERSARETAEKRVKELEAGLREVCNEWVNPGDGAPFEPGELPILDRARALLSSPSPSPSTETTNG
jgi:hypothetical protein